MFIINCFILELRPIISFGLGESGTQKKKEKLLEIKTRKPAYLGHVMRNDQRYELLQLILEGNIDGGREPGKRKTSQLKNLQLWFNTTTVGLFRAAADKIPIHVTRLILLKNFHVFKTISV